MSIASAFLHRFRIACIVAIGGVILLDACQSSGPSEPTPTERKVHAAFTYGDEVWKRPDSATWSSGGDSARGVDRVEQTPGTTTVHMTLPTGLGSVTLSLWVGGMRTATLVCQVGTGEALTSDPNSMLANPVAMKLLAESRLDGQRRLDSFLVLYARHLVDHDTGYAGFPKNCPVGIDSAAVVRAALIYATTKTVPVSTLAKSWYLEIDTARARSIVQELVKANLVSDSAANRAFPPYPVRVSKAISLSDLEIGGHVGVGGIFVGDSGLKEIGWKVRQGAEDRSNLFKTTFAVQMALGSTRWVLDSNMSIVDNGAAAGSYQLVIWALDRADRVDSSRASFEVVPPKDRTGPRVTILSPSPDSILENKDSTIRIRAKAVDPSGLDSVCIQGVRVDSVAGIWSREVLVPATGVSFAIHVAAFDRQGNSSDSIVRVVRKSASGNLGAVRLERISPSAASVPDLGASDSTLYVKFVAASPNGIADTGMRIDGVHAHRVSDSTWSREVPIPATGLEYTILVELVDQKGQRMTDYVKAVRTRIVPTPRFAIQFDSTNGGPALRAGSYVTKADSVVLVWGVTGQISGCTFKLDGMPAAISTGTVRAKVAVPLGNSAHSIQAYFGNDLVGTDTVRIHRYPSLSIRRIAPISDTVGSRDTAVQVVWEVVGAKSIVLDGGSVALSGTSRYSRALGPLAYGSNKTTVLATDSLGGIDSSAAVIYRLTSVDVLIELVGSSAKQWDSASFRISSANAGTALSWSKDSLVWNVVASGGVVSIPASGWIWAKGVLAGFASTIRKSDSATVRHTNTAPSYQKLFKDPIQVSEDADTVRKSFAAQIMPGSTWDLRQRTRFEAKALAGSEKLFSVQPRIDSTTGLLVFKVAADISGEARVRVLLRDDGDTANKGVDSSTADTIVVRIVAVNDAPVISASASFPATAGMDNMGVQVNSSPGPNEAGQKVKFKLSPLDSLARLCFPGGAGLYLDSVDFGGGKFLLLSVGPSLACPEGDVKIRLLAKDDGDTVGGGIDSAEKILTVQVQAATVDIGGKACKIHQFDKLVWTTEDAPAGSVYDGAEAATICPAGWRLPTKDDWSALVAWAGGATHLRTSTWQKNAGDDAIGFHLSHTVYSNYRGSFTELAAFWISSDTDLLATFRPDLGFVSASDLRDELMGGMATLSSAIRCVK